MNPPSPLQSARAGLWHLRKKGLPGLVEWQRRQETLTEVRTALWHFRRGGARELVSWQKRRTKGTSEVEPPKPKAPELTYRVDFESYEPRDVGPRRPDITAAVVLDDFTADAFSHEWNIIRLRRDDWVSQMKGQKIDVLFVESAWHGNGDQWARLIGKQRSYSPELRDLIVWCRASGIPTVFWNKEDPPHYADFVGSAGLFDLVLTTDSNKIPQYRKDLGHDAVAVMPFAAQTEIHSPARNGVERDVRGVAFGGMYFAHKFPQRRDQMKLLLGGAIDAEKKTGDRLEIFSRYLGEIEKYQFPGELGEHVVGSLSYDRMLRAYRAYEVFLNVNTVTNSPTMCARRLFEITACGTSVVTTPSAAVREYFAEDEILVATSRKQAENHLRSLVQSPELRDRMVHRAQRKIWDRHTYAHRAEAILEQLVPEKHRPLTTPRVSVLVPTVRPQQLEHIARMVGQQKGVEIQLILLTHGFDPSTDDMALMRDVAGVDVVQHTVAADRSLGYVLNEGAAIADGSVLSKMDDDDYYGPQYLKDLLRAKFHSRADVVGKAAHYMHLADRDIILRRQPDQEHRFVDGIIGPTITADRQVFLDHPFGDRTRGEDSTFLKDVRAAGGVIYAADRFNFCQLRGRQKHTWNVHDEAFLATGRVEGFGDPIAHVTV
ncbi:glycosyltransferase [Kocuria sp.]|uniref:glycosyltransferase family protein n=1 Tax=Kocuria sp. TaxID=1871328 RepID=UPI0025C53946|nr:glycosyltransferase [Kocuria sp.]